MDILRATFLFALTSGIVMNVCGEDKVHAFTIVRQGKPACRIIVPYKTVPHLEFAAAELQNYIRKISGAELPIERIPDSYEVKKWEKRTNYILVGESVYTRRLGITADGLKPDGFLIITRENYLILLGRDDMGEPMQGFRGPLRFRETYNKKLGISAFGETGSLYAVYHLLDILGVRWFMPGKVGEIIPKLPSIKLDNLNIKKEPVFTYRYPNLAIFNNNDEWAKWYKRIGFGTDIVLNINHSFQLFQKYANTHPEYFAIIDGKRDLDSKACRGGGSLCLSEEKVLKQMVYDIRSYFDKNPRVMMFPVMPTDSYNKTCECPPCAGKIDRAMGEDGKFSDYVWEFVNKVAKEIYKSHPDRYIVCCSYGHYQLPPKTVKEFSSNVGVVICKMRKDYWNPEYKEKCDRRIEQWSRRVKNIYLWEYYNWYQRESHIFGVPVIFSHLLQEDLQFLKRLGVKGEFIETDFFPNHKKKTKRSSIGMLHYPLYLTAKLLWDPDSDVEAILKDYCQKFYGPGAQTMMKFFHNAEAVWNRPEMRGKLYMDTEVLKTLSIPLNSAIQQVSKSSLYYERIELLINEFAPVPKMARVPVPNYECGRTDDAPVIDGGLDDKCWQNAKKIQFVGQITGKVPFSETEARIQYDDQNLYIALKCYESDTSKLITKAKHRDEGFIWDDDCVEMFFDTANSQEEYFHFIVNAEGVQWDAQHKMKFYSNFDWESNFKATTYIDKAYWNLEVAIPLKDLGIKKISEEDEWRINLVRNHASADMKRKRSSWSPTLGGSSHVLSRFGILVFK